MNYSSFILADQTVSENKKELEDLKAKLEAILLIVEKYKEHDGLGAINYRIEKFCQCVASSCHIPHSPIHSRAITLQFEMVKALQKQSRLTCVALSTKDADLILKALRNISSLCDAFQVSFSSY